MWTATRSRPDTRPAMRAPRRSSSGPSAPPVSATTPFPGRPGAGDAVFAAVAFQTLVDPVGDPEQRQLPQRGQVTLPEVVAQCGVDDPAG